MLRLFPYEGTYHQLLILIYFGVNCYVTNTMVLYLGLAHALYKVRTEA